MWLQMVSWQTILTILVLGNGILCSRQQGQVSRPRIARQDHHVENQNTSLPSSPGSLLNPRVAALPSLLGDEWSLDHHAFTCLLPLATAAAELVDFYENIAAYASMTDAATARRYRLWMGEILMEAVAPDGYDIPWAMIQNFALWMLERTRRGFVSTYQINFIHRTTGALLTFSLWVGYSRVMADVSR